MGGTNERTVVGHRMHVSGTEVHIHDDSKYLKFRMPSKDFKKAVEDTMKDLTTSPGIIQIVGASGSATLCLGSSDAKNKDLFMFLMGSNQSVNRELTDFVKNL